MQEFLQVQHSNANLQTRRLLADKQLSMTEKFDISMGRLMSLKQRLIQNREKSRNALIAAQTQLYQKNSPIAQQARQSLARNRPLSKIRTS